MSEEIVQAFLIRALSDWGIVEEIKVFYSLRLRYIKMDGSINLRALGQEFVFVVTEFALQFFYTTKCYMTGVSEDCSSKIT